MTAPAADPGSTELLQRLRHRLVDAETQLRNLRISGWRPDALRGMHEDIGRLHGVAERVQPELSATLAPLLHSLLAALSAPSMPSTTQTVHMLAQACRPKWRPGPSTPWRRWSASIPTWS